MNNKISLLIIDSDEMYAKELVKTAMDHIDFEYVEYVTDGAEGYERMKLIRPDVVLIDFLVAGMDAIGFLRKMDSDSNIKRPRVMIISQTMIGNMVQLATMLGVEYFIKKPLTPLSACETVAFAMSHPEPERKMTEPDDIDEKITQFIHCMGVPAHLDGHKYIRSALKIAIEDISIISPITKRLYPDLAKMYKKSPSSIERSIRHAISVSWSRGNQKLIREVFGYSAESCVGYPTNSEYIAMIADDLRLRIKHDMI